MSASCIPNGKAVADGDALALPTISRCSCQHSECTTLVSFVLTHVSAVLYLRMQNQAATESEAQKAKSRAQFAAAFGDKIKDKKHLKKVSIEALQICAPSFAAYLLLYCVCFRKGTEFLARACDLNYHCKLIGC